MIIQIFKDGSLSKEFEFNNSEIELSVIPSVLIKNCSITLEAFEELFFNELKKTNNTYDAYEQAEEAHERFFGRRRFKNYETFYSTKSRKFK